MNGKIRMDDGGDTESPFFYAKDRGEHERKSDMELHISLMASQCLSRQIGNLLGRRGHYV
jgi:hypothetical protein